MATGRADRDPVGDLAGALLPSKAKHHPSITEPKAIGALLRAIDGKTRAGAEWTRHQVESGACRQVGLVAPTAADARDVMVEGPSGLLNIPPPWSRPTYEPSKRRLTWPSGAVAHVYSADEPDRLRGPQHDGAWCDEIAAWRYSDTWEQLMLGLRAGTRPQVVVTTTPRPTRVVKQLIASASTVVTRGSTFDNAANLAPSFLDEISRRYEGTRLGRQELYAEILEDVPGALWTRDLLERCRCADTTELKRIVIGVDPAVSSSEESAETGVVVVGKGVDGSAYVLEDRSCRATPDGWARLVVDLYNRHQADRVVAEVNNGGDLVEEVLRTVSRDVAYKAVRASRGKMTRAEPVAALYEQGRVRHVGDLALLEDQMCEFTADSRGPSPDRVDALVWAITELKLSAPDEPRFIAPILIRAEPRGWWT